MNFKIFDDLVGSALGASQEFRFREGKHSAKHYSAMNIENCFKNLHKISKIFQKFLVKFKKN